MMGVPKLKSNYIQCTYQLEPTIAMMINLTHYIYTITNLEMDKRRKKQTQIRYITGEFIRQLFSTTDYSSAAHDSSSNDSKWDSTTYSHNLQRKKLG